MSCRGVCFAWSVMVMRVAVLTLLVGTCGGSGYFEMELLSFTHPGGEVAAGPCCAGPRDPLSRLCPPDCPVYIHLCLKEHQDRVTTDGPCTFGNATRRLDHLGTAPGGQAVTEAPGDRIHMPFDFAWTKAFSLILEVRRYSSDTEYGDDALVDVAVHSGAMLPGPTWHQLHFFGARTEIDLQVRVVCGVHYYNQTCTKFCRPRHDKFGHYRCTAGGDKACLEGWAGANCEIAVCKTKCHPVHGFCHRPGECRCAFGWQGPLCDQCIPYPGCRHGSCVESPWQCKCHHNWGGILCDKDLNPCGHKPCANGSVCRNTEPNHYECACPHGYTGSTCDRVIDAPVSAPCVAGGRTYGHGTSWQDACNVCRCQTGVVSCTEVLCGPRNCLPSANTSEPTVPCPPGETCVGTAGHQCFTPPCLPWGVCMWDGLYPPPPARTHPTPRPGDSPYTYYAKVTLRFDKTKMPTGVTVQLLCHSLQALDGLQDVMQAGSLLLHCDWYPPHQDTIQLLLTRDPDASNASVTSDDPGSHQLTTQAVQILTEAVTKHGTNNTALNGVIEVKVETMLNESAVLEGVALLLLPLLCSLIGLAGIICILCLIVYHHRHANKAPPSPHPPGGHSQQPYQKPNNTKTRQVEQHEADPRGGGSVGMGAPEFVDMCLEHLGKHTSSTYPFTDLPKKKENIQKDIELSGESKDINISTKKLHRWKETNIGISPTTGVTPLNINV